MRTKSSNGLYFDFSGVSSVKVARDYRARYEAISQILDANGKLLTLAHRDWARLLSTSSSGRDGYTSEQLLRSLIVMVVESDSYRDVITRIDNSEFLRHFVRLGVKPTMDFTFLNKAACALSAETLEAMNQVVNHYALQEEKISGEKQRMDTTVYETNIRYPTDSSLLWDSFRTLSRLLRNVHKELPQLHLRHRYHDKKVKKLFTFISRNASSKNKRTLRKVKSAYRQLIDRVRWIHAVGQEVLVQAGCCGYQIEELEHYLPLVEQIIDQADQRVLQGICLPSDEKLYSLFEEHTELIKRGKAAKPIEFGHKVLFCQTGEKFIHHYRVMGKRIDDTELLAPAIEAHKQLFGEYPDLLSADKGFYQSMDQVSALEEKIPVVSIAKKGRRNVHERQRETSEDFIAGQRFRAGSEGSISVLKRAFKLGRCLLKGFKHYAASVGLAVLCHNLVLLARL